MKDNNLQPIKIPMAFFTVIEKRIKRNDDNLRDLQDNMNIRIYSNIQIIRVPEEEDKKKGHEKILEEIII